MNVHLPSAPHAHASDSVPRIMGLVLLAVAPAITVGS
jgi:Na+-translocating ferredoxin:NAD+ oxidoreductase RnfD subunit